MYGAKSDSGYWEYMLHGTVESVFNNANAEEQPGDELGKLDNQNQLQTSSSMLAGMI